MFSIYSTEKSRDGLYRTVPYGTQYHYYYLLHIYVVRECNPQGRKIFKYNFGKKRNIQQKKQEQNLSAFQECPLRDTCKNDNQQCLSYCRRSKKTLLSLHIITFKIYVVSESNKNGRKSLKYYSVEILNKT